MTGPFEIPDSWDWASFGSVATVVSDLVDPAGYQNSPHLAPNNIEQNTGRLLPYRTIAEDGVASPKNRFIPGQILYSKIRPYLAKAVVAEFGGLCSADMYPIESSIDVRYLWRWIIHPEFTRAASRHEGRNVLPKINKAALATLPVPVPPVEEQKRIAAVLDQVDDLRAKRREAIGLLDDLAQSIFLEMFDPDDTGTQVVSIDELCSVVVDCVNRTAPVVDSVTPFRMIRTTNVKNGRVDLRVTRYVEEEVFRRWNRRATPRRGDVLLTREAPVGEVGILDTDDQVFLGQRLMLYRVDPDRATAEYLSAALRSPYLKGQYEQSGSGSTVKHLSLPTCRSLKVPAPNISAQRQFAARIARLDELKAGHNRHLAALDELFESVQQRAFAGQLWDHEAA
ncbi:MULTISPECIES: restriction endonuclease subunit S [unclassified Streptomyces]|uniref:restriction endonuclease subunit S n=1 Tax=unclassified Streptomyces TaxID=2593676 RepID=UPI003817A16F